MSGPAGSEAGLSVTLGVRPSRVGVLVPQVKGVSWLRLFELAIAAQARTWGGSGHLVFPMTDAFAESELFWELADRLDADHWANYLVTFGDMEALAPAWYRAQMRHIESQLSAYDQDARDDFLRRQREVVIATPEPSESVQDALRRRLAPLHHTGSTPALLEPSTAEWAPGWPYTDVTTVDGLPGVVRNPVTRLGPVFSLLLTTEVGRLSPAAVRAIEAAGPQVRNEELRSPAQWAHFLFDHPRTPSDVYPWTLSEHALAWYLGSPMRKDRVVLVVGDSAWDFALFYALRRWTSLAFWLPSWLDRRPPYRRLLGQAVQRWVRRTNAPLAVTTTSRRTARRDAVTRELRADGLRTEAYDWRDTLPDEPNRLFEHVGRGRSQHVPLSGGVSTPLPTPVPRVQTRDPAGLLWMTDVVVEGWAPVRNAKLGPALIEHRNYGPEMVRTTRTGVSYLCPHFFFPAGGTLEGVTVRPRLRPLGLMDQVRLLVADAGWRVEPSDKGVFAAETTRLFGGRDSLVETLRDKPIAALLDAFLRGPAGIEVNGQRCLSLRHVADEVFAGDAGAARAAVDNLAGKAVLLRGLVLGCERCRQQAWYALGDVGDDFRCVRCRQHQRVEGRWRGHAEPIWFYKLDEVVRQFLAHNGELPIMAVQDRFASSSMPVDQAFEVKFTKVGGTAEFELDLAVSEGHRLWFGEATTNGHVKPLSRVNNLKRLVTQTDAYGAFVATSRASLAKVTADRLAAQFRASFPRLEVASRVQRGR